MKRWSQAESRLLFAVLLGTALGTPGTLRAQQPAEIRDELMRQFSASMRKLVALAGAMPPDAYTWSPGEGVMEVGHVYMHVAHYNYLYPTQNLHLPLPEGIDMDGMESIRDKEEVVAALERSRDWVLEAIGAMEAPDLEANTILR